MSLLILIAKITIILFFLIMFLRSNRAVWGVGLLTVTLAILLDTFLSTFGQDEMLEELGFFFYVISGAIFAGAAVWLWGLLRLKVAESIDSPPSNVAEEQKEREQPVPSPEPPSTADTTFDRQMMYDQIRYRFGPDDILDLVFDLGINENDVIALNQDNKQLIVNIIDIAVEQGKTGELALAVERILTPIPEENLPRLEKLNADSPQTVLRHYLLANYSMDELEQMAQKLSVDWDIIAGDSKKSKVRNLLLYLYRRNRVDELIDLMQASEDAPKDAPGGAG